MTEKALADAFPLAWPTGWPRTEAHKRERSNYKMNFGKARDELLRELRLFRGRDVVISSNLPLKQNGMPYADYDEPRDPGIAVYWRKRSWVDGSRTDLPMVMACDHWRTVRENLHAVGLAISGLRLIERTGASSILDRAYTGFQALPPSTAKPWRVVLGLNDVPDVTRAHIHSAYRLLARAYHPDAPAGSHDAMVELNAARDAALLEIGL